MNSKLEESFARALQKFQGDDPVAEIARASLLAAAGKHDPSRRIAKRESGLNFRIADSEASGSLISATEAGDFLQRLQKAVARLAKARRARVADVARLLPGDFELARLDVSASWAGSLIVDLVPSVGGPPESRSERFSPDGFAWAEIGAAELVRALPESVDDDASIDSLSSASPVIRRAIADLIQDLQNPNRDLSFSLHRESGERITSCLTASQARVMRERLDVVREEREVIRRRGRLDGLRTRRHIFYLELPTGEIHGYLDDSLMDAVKANLEQEVEVALETFFTSSGLGKKSQRQYRLIEVAGHKSQMPAQTDFDSPVE
ncbi:hypothetical protein AB0I39_01465 [Kitasatospora purpeofusca]|uniref:hypothetical protein n=1 Tax=Kitasatospora purpeofusca TaxID=67352 RepID=UPI0033C17A3B